MAQKRCERRCDSLELGVPATVSPVRSRDREEVIPVVGVMIGVDPHKGFAYGGGGQRGGGAAG